MNVVVVQSVFDMATASQSGLLEVCISPGGSGTRKEPCIEPTIPLSTVPTVPPGSHEPGLGPVVVTKLPLLNCSTTRNVPSGFVLTVKCRSNVSVAQSGPHVPESGEVLV